MKRELILGLLTIGGLTACVRPPSFDPSIIEHYRADAQSKHRAFSDMSRQVQSIRLPQDVAELPLDDVNFHTESQHEGAGAPVRDGIILDSSILEPGARPNYAFELGDRCYFLGNTRELLATRSEDSVPGTAEYAHEQFRQLLALRYAIVLREVSMEQPVADGGGFMAGEYVGEALVFELADDTAQFLGGFRFGGTNSDTVKVRYESDREYQKHEWLVSDLKYNVYVSLHDRLLARAPNVKLAPTDWYKSTL